MRWAVRLSSEEAPDRGLDGGRRERVGDAGHLRGPPVPPKPQAGPVSPPAPQTADRQYMEGFNDELDAFKERVRSRAKLRIEKAMKEYEEEERRKRLGPGGLDPVEVYESLPEVRPPAPGGQPAGGPGAQALTPALCSHRSSRNASTSRTCRCSKIPLARWTPQ